MRFVMEDGAGFDLGPGPEGAGRTVYRPARLFRAGAYEDKGLTVTEGDLDGLIARFSAARSQGARVPVKVEHIDTPFDGLAEVVAVGRTGGALFGIVALDADLDAVLRRRGIESLSVGLDREPLALREVSLVLRPRVPDAALMTQSGAAAKTARFAAQGKLTPATVGLAEQLLSVAVPAAFADGQAADAAALFERFLNALPPVQPRGVLPVPGFAPTPPGAAASPEASALAARLGIDAQRLAARL